MRIAVITLHWASNYGAALQTLATQEVMGRYGDVKIVDYRNAKVGLTMMPLRLSWNRRSLLRVAKDLLRLPSRFRTIRKFKNFISKRLSLTESVQTYDDLRALENHFDVFVSGSDQLWNPQTVSENGSIDRMYFLEPISSRRKISFSSSIGSYRFTEAETDIVRSLLKSFHMISVREKDTADNLAKLMGQQVSHLPDPTLLLTREEWISICGWSSSPGRGDYIFVYALHKDKQFSRIVEAARHALGLRVYAIDQDPILGFEADRHDMDSCPIAFVQALARAAFVVTNSFHGTAFAVNLGVPFVSVSPPSGANRLSSFLDTVSLRNRLIDNIEDLDALLDTDIDFAGAHEKISVMRSEAQSYLEKSIK